MNNSGSQVQQINPNNAGNNADNYSNADNGVTANNVDYNVADNVDYYAANNVDYNTVNGYVYNGDYNYDNANNNESKGKGKSTLLKILGFAAIEMIAVIASICALGYGIDKYLIRGDGIGIISSGNSTIISGTKEDIEITVDGTNTYKLVAYDENERHSAFSQLEPIKEDVYDSSTSYYYDLSQVQEIGKRCDDRHFIMTYDELTEKLADVRKNITFTRQHMSTYETSTVYKSHPEDARYYFDTTINEYSDNIDYSVDYDSATGEIHRVNISTDEKNEEYIEYTKAVIAAMFDGYSLQRDLGDIIDDCYKDNNTYTENYGDVVIRINSRAEYTYVTITPAY